MNIRRRIAVPFVTLVLAALFASTTSIASASVPAILRAKHEGKGKIEVDFRQRVNYRNLKVTVKDMSGKQYSVKVVDRDNNDIDFRIGNYKRGKTYKFVISGIRKVGTSRYGSVSGRVKIAAASSQITKTKALQIAKSHAKSRWGAASYYDVDVERDTYAGKGVWEVSFESRSGNRLYDYEYQITRISGKILHIERELDD